jgi:hypothetical protein
MTTEALVANVQKENEIIAREYRRFRRGLITATEMVEAIDKKLAEHRESQS